MKLSIISFTEKGKRLSERIRTVLAKEMEVCLYTMCKACKGEKQDTSVFFVETSVGDWAREQMWERNALLFIGACGIAVRAIAPSLTDKLHDVPVLVMDENGNHIIPILSGHMGGANELADYMAAKTGAEPVITTATDINQKFAVDLFAKRNGLSVIHKDGIVKVSSKVLAGKEITVSVEPGYRITADENCGGKRVDGKRETLLPAGMRMISYPPLEAADIVISSEKREFDTALLLRPREYIIGMGCKRGKREEEIEDFISRKINELGISVTQIYAFSSISQKRDEPGMIAWCRRNGIPFFTYTAKELQEVKGEFSGSDFVRAQTGVDNVCERAALKACGTGGKLILSKYAKDGMTLAIAKREWMVCFYVE